MTRLALGLAVACGILLVVIAYLSVTVIQQRDEIACAGRQGRIGVDCS